MPNLLAAVAATFVLSLALAYWLLRLRCREIGPPFAPHARPWALLIVVATAVASAGVGLLVAAVSHQTFAAFAGLVVAAGLWFAKVPPQRDLDMLPRTLASLPTLPFSRLYEQMGEDMQDWIDIRVQAASAKPQWIADAATYYWNQARRLEGGPAWDRLSGWQESIAHKIGLVRLIDQDIGPELLPNYTEEDQLRLARRLEVEALNELNLFLSYVYRLGYYKMPIYPFRPPTVGKTRHAVRVLSAQ